MYVDTYKIPRMYVLMYPHVPALVFLAGAPAQRSRARPGGHRSIPPKAPAPECNYVIYRGNS